jgi:hypothetical protein
LKESTKALVEENDKLNESLAGSSDAYSNKAANMAAEANASRSLADRIAALSAVENKSAEQKRQLTAYVGMLNDSLGESVLHYDAENDSMSRNVDEIYAIIAARAEEARGQAARERAVEIAKEQMVVEEQLAKNTRQRIELDEALAAGEMKKQAYNKAVKELEESEAALIAQQADLIISFDDVTQTIADAAVAQAEAAGFVSGELQAANAVQDRLAQERISREEEVTEAMIIAASEQGMALEDYKATLQRTQRDEEAEYKKRQDTLKRYTDTATDMFKRLDGSTKTTVAQMTANMKHNQQVMENWADNLTALAERGINQGLLERLRNAGPESAGTVAALVKASDKELEELNSVFANGSKVATDALLQQLGLPDVVNSGADMVDSIAGGVESSKSLTDATVRMVEEAKRTAVSSVNSSGFDTVGKSIIDGVYKGFTDRERWFRQQITTFFKNTVRDVKKELGIQSPSAVFAAIGTDMARGVGVGFEEQMRRVSLDMQRVMPTTLDTSAAGTAAVTGGAAAGTVVNHNVAITSPKALSEKEMAREFYKLSRKLALVN